MSVSRTGYMPAASRDDWETPQPLFDELHAEFGFTLDVAASDHNAKLPTYYTEIGNGLEQPWDGVCWCNPPYGRELPKWVEKAVFAQEQGATVVMLVPARTDTRWWHDLVIPHAEVRFIRGRIVFTGAQHNAPFPSAILVFRGGVS